MILELIIEHVCSRVFIYELIVMSITYIILGLIHQIKRRHSRFQLFKYYSIPGPEPNMLAGNYFDYELFSNKLRKDIEYREKYGDFVGFFIGDEACIQTTDLEVIRQVFLVEKEVFCERSKTIIDIPLSRGLLFARYPRWRPLRTMLSPPFAKFHRRGAKSSQIVEDTLRELINYIDTKYDDCKQKQKPCILDIRSLMKASSLHLINTMAIGLPGLKVRENEPTVALLDEFIEKGNKGFVVLAVLAPVFRKIFSCFMRNFQIISIFKKIHKCLDDMIADGLIQIRKTYPLFESQEKSFAELRDSMIPRSKSSTSVVKLNLGAKSNMNRIATTTNSSDINNNTNAYTNDNNNNKADEDESESREELAIETMVRSLHEGKLSRYELYGTAEIILLAGYDTTATTLAYVFWVIANDQELQTKLRSTLVAHGIESEFLKQVLYETLRLYPVAPYIATRLATKTIKIKQWVIPSGTKVIYNSWLVHRDPAIWENPLEFKPERFSDTSKHHPCAFAPFGMGDKRCLAYQLAQLEMKMIVCDILLRYKIKLVRPKTLDIEPIGFVTTQPIEEVFIDIERLETETTTTL